MKIALFYNRTSETAELNRKKEYIIDFNDKFIFNNFNDF